MLSICYVMSCLCMCKRWKPRNLGQSHRRVPSGQPGCQSKDPGGWYIEAKTRTSQSRVLQKARILHLIEVCFNSQLWPVCHSDFGGSRRGWEVHDRAKSHLHNYRKRLKAYIVNHHMICLSQYSTFYPCNSWGLLSLLLYYNVFLAYVAILFKIASILRVSSRLPDLVWFAARCLGSVPSGQTAF